MKVDFLGFSLKNPLMLTEGPLSGTLDGIERAGASGAALIFTKGIRPDPVKSPVPYIRKYEKSLVNADWSCIGLKAWLELIKKVDIEVPLVTSIAKNYVTPSLAVEMAEKLQAAGARIISFVDYDPVQLVETVKLARPLLKVPLMVKLPPFLQNLEEVLTDLVKAGVDAIAAMDSIGPVLTIDYETGEPLMGSGDGSGYLSGKYILPVTLKYIYEISGFVDVPVVGVGGVNDYKSAIQMIMAGATGVGMVTQPMLAGLDIFGKTATKMDEYLSAKGITDLKEIRGLTRQIVEKRKVELEPKALIDEDRCKACGLCLPVCYSQAIGVEEKTYDGNGKKRYFVIRNECVGCGLCDSVCTAGAISFT